MDTMEDVAMEDEKKPFDAEHAGNEDDTQPDPDEELIMQANNGRVWLVKVCTSLARCALFRSLAVADTKTSYGTMVFH